MGTVFVCAKCGATTGIAESHNCTLDPRDAEIARLTSELAAAREDAVKAAQEIADGEEESILLCRKLERVEAQLAVFIKCFRHPRAIRLGATDQMDVDRSATRASAVHAAPNPVANAVGPQSVRGAVSDAEGVGVMAKKTPLEQWRGLSKKYQQQVFNAVSYGIIFFANDNRRREAHAIAHDLLVALANPTPRKRTRKVKRK